jgi:ferric-dicitrate binding protein FerR (iron transport regulator)
MRGNMKKNKNIVDSVLDYSLDSDKKQLDLYKDLENFEEQSKAKFLFNAVNRTKSNIVSKEALTNEDFNTVLSQLEPVTKKTKVLGIYKYAVAVIIALIGLGFYMWEKDSNFEYKTKMDQVTSFKLIDGSKITMEQNSVLNLADNFNNQVRKVHFKGEALFDIEKDINKKFIIDTEYGKVLVLGTKFKLEVKPQQNKLNLFLEEGKVNIVLNNDKEIVVEPYEFVTYNAVSNKLTKTSVSQKINFSLSTNYFSFSNEKLNEVVKFLNIHFKKNIRIKNKDLLNKGVSGSYKAHNALEVIEGFKDLIGFELKIVDEKNIIIY